MSLSPTREKMSEELSVLKLVCRGLDQAAIPYMLTGSFAANFYATPRMTRDIDIVIAIQKPRIDKFLQIFQNDFYVDRIEIIEAIEAPGMFNILHNETVLKIDFIVLKDTPYREAEFQRRRRIQLDNASIWIVAPEDLIISKLFWAKESLSALQLGDIHKLLTGHVVLDREYIRHWINELDLQQVYEKVNIDG